MKKPKLICEILNLIKTQESQGLPGKVKRRKLYNSFGNKENTVRNTVYKINRLGLIVKTDHRNRMGYYRLTEEGEEFLKKNLFTEKDPVRTTWDRDFCVVIFDIPEEKRQRRYLLRKKLRELGFKFLQKSVWYHTHDVFEEIDSYLKEKELLDYARAMKVSNITELGKLKEET